MKEKKKETVANIRKGRDGPILESTQVRAGPCQDCGQLSVGIWKGKADCLQIKQSRQIAFKLIKVGIMPSNMYKIHPSLGGGYNMGVQTQDQSPSQNHKDVGNIQESYIKSLIQQIKILELETEYLKNQNPDAGRKEVHMLDNKLVNVKEKEHEESLTKLKAELQTALAKVENIKLEKQKLLDRMKHLELQRDDEKAKLLDQVSKLTGRVEHLEKEAEDNEVRQSSLLQDLEKQGIISKDRERTIQQLTEELDMKKEEINGHISQLDQLQAEIGSKQTIITQLQEKFMQSSMHILQETVKGMQDELKDCYVRLRDYEYKEDDWKQMKDKMDSLKTTLIDENADLKSQLTCVKSELDGEIRTREHRSNKGTMDSQDLLMLREKEQQLKAENARYLAQIEKLNERIKGLQVCFHPSNIFFVICIFYARTSSVGKVIR